MPEFFRRLFQSDFMPHGHCFFWRPDVVWTHVVSDALIALAYYSIPFVLVHLVRKRSDLAFPRMFILFGLFIFACGTTHLMSIYTLWVPVYRLEGLVKAITAAASILTAIALIPLVPKILALPRPAELAAANSALQNEIRERRAAEAEVRSLNAELEQRVAERTEQLQRSNLDLQRFAYAASHDLQEPLRMVASYTQLLAKRYRGRLDEDADQYIQFAADGAVRMSELISNLLTYARIDSQPLPYREVDSGRVLDVVLTMFHEPMSTVGATVERETPLPAVWGDEAQVALVFQNLISNALRYRSSSPLRIRIAARRAAEGFVQFEVQDNGIGIETQYREEIFIMFRRLHGGDRPGSGIGLATCRKIVERHGGRMWVESAPGSGSRFCFTLPDSLH